MESAVVRRAMLSVVFVCAFVAARTAFDVVFPMVPFKTDNTVLRSLCEWPFYLFVYWVSEHISGGQWHTEGLPLSIAVGLTEAVSLLTIGMAGRLVLRARQRT